MVLFIVLSLSIPLFAATDGATLLGQRSRVFEVAQDSLNEINQELPRERRYASIEALFDNIDERHGSDLVERKTHLRHILNAVLGSFDVNSEVGLISAQHDAVEGLVSVAEAFNITVKTGETPTPLAKLLALALYAGKRSDLLSKYEREIVKNRSEFGPWALCSLAAFYLWLGSEYLVHKKEVNPGIRIVPLALLVGTSLMFLSKFIIIKRSEFLGRSAASEGQLFAAQQGFSKELLEYFSDIARSNKNYINFSETGLYGLITRYLYPGQLILSDQENEARLLAKKYSVVFAGEKV